MVERLGARMVFTGAIVLFTLSSIACGFTNSPFIFDIARAIQGIGGALMVPVGKAGRPAHDRQDRSDARGRGSDVARPDRPADRTAARRLSRRGVFLARDLLRRCAVGNRRRPASPALDAPARTATAQAFRRARLHACRRRAGGRTGRSRPLAAGASSTTVVALGLASPCYRSRSSGTFRTPHIPSSMRGHSNMRRFAP